MKRNRSDPRNEALRLLLRWERGGWIVPPPSDRLTGAGASEHPFARKLAFGVLRHLLYIDWLLSRYCRPPLDTLPAPIRNVLRLGVFQIRKSADVPVWSAVDESVKLAGMYGHRGTVALVNAVLRRVSRGGNDGIPAPDRDAVAHIAVTTSHPAWMVRRWVGRWGVRRTLALCNGNNSHPPLTLFPNLRKGSRDALSRALEEIQVSFEPGRYNGDSFRVKEPRTLLESDIFASGSVIIQDEFQSLVCRLLDPGPGQLVVDLCAAPGGKSAAIYSMAGPDLEILSIDISPRRLRAMRSNMKRLGYGEIRLVCADLRHTPFTVRADRILLDVPCSGTGVLSKRPDIKWSKSEEVILHNAALQTRLLEVAGTCMGVGGILVYSTCSLEEEENEGVVRQFLGMNNNFRICKKSIDLVPSVLHTDLGVKLVSEDGIPGGFAAPLERTF